MYRIALLLVLCEVSIAQEVAFPRLFPLEAHQAAEMAVGEIIAMEKGFPNLDAVAPECVDATISAMAAADAEDRLRGVRGTRWGSKGKVDEIWEEWGDRVVTECKQASAARLIADTQEWTERPAPPWLAVWHGVLLRMGASSRGQVLEELGLSGEQASALVAFGMDIPARGTRLHEGMVREAVCERRRTFETPAAIGRALADAHARRVAEEERLFQDIERVLSPESLDKVFRYAIEHQPTIREIDYEAWYSKLGPELAERFVDRRCAIATAFAPPSPLSQSSDEVLRRRRR